MSERSQQPSVDHYAEIAKAMRTGLLITVNESGGAQRTGPGQMRVVAESSFGAVLLSGFNDRSYRLRPDTTRGMELVELHDGGHETHECSVETIEVIGVDE